MGASITDKYYNKVFGIKVNTTEDYMSDIVPDNQKDRAKELAMNHVDWLLNIMRPLLITEFLHGFRHGFEQADIVAIKEDVEDNIKENN